MEGLTDRNIAKQLGIGYSTVRRHKERMQDANGCRSMRELVALLADNRTEEEDAHEN